MAIYCSHLHTNPCTHGENWCVSSLRKHPERRTFNQSSSTCLIFVLNNNGFNLILFLSSIRLETSPWSMSFQVKFLLRMKKKFTTQFFFSFPKRFLCLCSLHSCWVIISIWQTLWDLVGAYVLKDCEDKRTFTICPDVAPIMIAQSENWGW